MIRAGHPTSPNASETILFRTRTEILTDQRIITESGMVSLRSVASARVVLKRYYVPLQAIRFVALFGAVALALSLAGLTGGSHTTGAQIMTLFGLLVTGAFAAFAPYLMPTHMIVLDTSHGSMQFLHSHSARYLRAVVDEINNAAEHLKQKGPQNG